MFEISSSKDSKFGSGEEDIGHDNDPLIGYQNHRVEKKSITVWAWIISTIFFALLSLKLGMDLLNLQVQPRYETGFSTDFEPVKSEIGVVEYRFTGGLELDQMGNLYRLIDSSLPQYAGKPRQEIDMSWENLLTASEISLSTDEVKSLKTATVKDSDGTYRMSLDMYHSIHCVNEVRKAIDFDYYYPTGKTPYFYRDHIDHCIDYLRQVVQCQADLTPLTYYWSEMVNTSIPIFGAPHTCRDFKKVHEWSMKRNAWREE